VRGDRMSSRSTLRRDGAAPEGSRWIPYLFVFPATVYLMIFQGYPLLQELYFSVTKTSLLRPRVHLFVGFDNYISLFGDPDFLKTLWITFIYTSFCVIFSVGFGLTTALLLNYPFRGRGLARALVTVPWAAPSVAVALIFTWMFNAQYGILSRLQVALGFQDSGTQYWLDSQTLALPAVLITTIWQIFPFSSVVILAALQGISTEVREAATIDGADRLSIFKAVTWPTIRPTVALVALFATIWSLRRFDTIWILTQGGPLGATNTLVTNLYREAFVYRRLGSAAAVGIVGLLLATLVTIVYYVLSNRGKSQEGAR
jgi:multiple sugar transport system permease protein